jgi:hypothetical protein
MDENGNLVGVKETVNFEEREVEEVEATQLRNELLVKSIVEGGSESEQNDDKNEHL